MEADKKSEKLAGNYIKDFDGWHPAKKSIHEAPLALIPFYKEREVWFCRVGCNIGYEQDGKGTEFSRPVVVVKKYNQHLFLGIPLTSKSKDFPFYFNVETINNQAATAIISQVRAYSSKRLMNKIAMMDSIIFQAMKKAAFHFLLGD